MNRIFALLFAIPILAGWTHGSTNSAAIPIVNAQTLGTGSPAANTQAVGTLTATNSPTSWGISSCSGCTGYFAVDSSGHITVTSTGASNLTANNTTTVVSLNLVVNATNAAGTSANATIPVNIYADGSVNTAAGSVQRATLLNGYVARPPWKVAGVDYAIGYGTTSLSDPSGIAVPGCTYTGGAHPNVTCTTAGQTISGFDFSLHNGVIFNCQAANITFKNNNVLVGSAVNSATGIINGNSSCSNFNVSYNIIDGGNASGSQIACTYAALILVNNSTTVEFNWLKNSGGQNFDIQAGTTINQRYNLIENSSLCVPNHNNYIQFNSSGTATYTSPASIYNTTYQSILNAGVNAGEGIQFEAQCSSCSGSGTVITNGEVGRNTIIAVAQGGSTTISAEIACHQDSGGGFNSNTGFTADNNYLDASGADTWAYSHTGTNVCPSPTYTNNTNMVTGTLFPTNP